MIQFENNINKLLDLYLAKKCKEEQFKKVKEWIAKSPENQEYFLRYKAISDSKRYGALLEDNEKSWQRLWISSKKERQLKLKSLLNSLCVNTSLMPLQLYYCFQ